MVWSLGLISFSEMTRWLSQRGHCQSQGIQQDRGPWCLSSHHSNECNNDLDKQLLMATLCKVLF